MFTQRTAIHIRHEPMSELRHHITVTSSFETGSILDVHRNAGAIELRERQLNQTYRKDYDSIEFPMDWPLRFDVSRWTLISAFDGDMRIGGATGAMDTAGLEILQGRSDLAVLWDLRVLPGVRRSGVRSALFRSIEAWARSRNCLQLSVETQYTSVAACAFYASQGCHLEQGNDGAYSDLPDEVQLIWSKGLS